jgi:transposase InsO family protein
VHDSRQLICWFHPCHDNGIRHLLTAPHSPTTTGKIERLHKTMRREFFDRQLFDTIEQAQAALDAWVAHDNTARAHQSIGDRPRPTGSARPQARLEVAEPAETSAPEPAPDRPAGLLAAPSCHVGPLASSPTTSETRATPG